MNNKIMKSYRFNKLIVEELNNVLKNVKVTETAFIEVAIIEKLVRLKANEVENKNINEIYKFINQINKNNK